VWDEIIDAKWTAHHVGCKKYNPYVHVVIDKITEFFYSSGSGVRSWACNSHNTEMMQYVPIGILASTTKVGTGMGCLPAAIFPINSKWAQKLINER
jgi:hypothetical protein